MATTYEPIATTTLGTANATITFSSIPSTYTDLRIIFNAKLTATGSTTTSSNVRFNSDTGANYSYTYVCGNGSTGSSGAINTTSAYLIETPNVASIWGLTTIDIFSYAGSTNKTALATCSADQNGSGILTRNVALWRSTSAINSVSLIASSSTWAVGTTATLYGILKA